MKVILHEDIETTHLLAVKRSVDGELLLKNHREDSEIPIFMTRLLNPIAKSITKKNKNFGSKKSATRRKNGMGSI